MPFSKFHRGGVCPVCNKVYYQVAVHTSNENELVVRCFWVHDEIRACTGDCDIFIPVPTPVDAADADAVSATHHNAGIDAAANGETGWQNEQREKVTG